MKILKIDSSNGRDMYATMECSCPDKRWADNEVLKNSFKTKIRFTGYNDDYFFSVVNKEPRERICDCGKKYNFQWKHDGVHVDESL